jgi:hypothetical protein
MLSIVHDWIRKSKRSVYTIKGIYKLIKLFCICILCVIVGSEFLPTIVVYAQVNIQNHTHVSTVQLACNTVVFSPDGNPFPLCPGPYPQGGNCTWWAWEQWHILGYNLPNNWRNAADWVVDATRAGLSVGTAPRVAAIAVFPRGDGYWAANDNGHVAFVTAISADGTHFDVTYQNYGDANSMYVGKDYTIHTINQPQFQNGELRFIYFPHPIDVEHWVKLPGISTGNAANAVNQANGSTNSNNVASTSQSSNNNNTASNNHNAVYLNDRIALGLAPVSNDRELKADFAGNGTGNLLLYNRQKGTIDIFRFDTIPIHNKQPAPKDPDLPSSHSQDAPLAQRVSLGDSITPVGKWGSSLDIHTGDFDGTSRDDILLYDRVTGSLQIISFNQDLSISKHVVLSAIGTNWEIYVARLDGKRSSLFLYKRYAFTDPYASISPTTSSNTEGGDSRGVAPPDWEKSGRTAAIQVIDFDQDFSIAHRQSYNLWHANWEVYVGSFVNAQQDGIFLYDRTVGEARLISFTNDLSVNDYQEMHNLTGNWTFYSGDFANAGHAQMFLYDPVGGNGQLLVFGTHLAIQHQQSYTNLGTNMVLYAGHFGLPTLSLMLYDVQNAQSTFIGFDQMPGQSLEITHRYVVKSWDQSQRILVGSFLDRAQCAMSNTCALDTILVLDRHTGQISRYAFSFGRQFQIYDNRVQGLMREGAPAASQHLISIDSSTFKLVATLSTTIRGEELY